MRDTNILADQSLCYKGGSGEMWIRGFVTYVRLVHFQGWTRSEDYFCKTSSEKPFQSSCTSRADKWRRLQSENYGLKWGGGSSNPMLSPQTHPINSGCWHWKQYSLQKGSPYLFCKIDSHYSFSPESARAFYKHFSLLVLQKWSSLLVQPWKCTSLT